MSRRRTSNYGFVIRISSPFEGAIRVRTQSRTGRVQRGPEFEIADQARPRGRSKSSRTSWSIAPARCASRIGRKPFNLNLLRRRRVLTSSRDHQLPRPSAYGDRDYTIQRRPLGVGEYVYGPRRNASVRLAKNGQSISIWNEDPGTGTELAYKSIPSLSHEPRLRRVRQPPGARRLRGRDGAGVGGAVQRPRRRSRLLRVLPASRSRRSRSTPRSPGARRCPPRWSFGLWLSTVVLDRLRRENSGCRSSTAWQSGRSRSASSTSIVCG